MVEVPVDSPEWDFVASLVEQRSRRYESHYRFGMKPLRLWKVLPGRLQREHRQSAAVLGRPSLLFHGTSPDSVKGILQSGFRLPRHAGMFGRGIYFAHCPLKSANYATKNPLERLWRYALGCLVGCVGACAVGAPGGGCLGGGFGCWLAHCSYSPQQQQMLLCEVFLGKSRKLRMAMDVNPSQDLKRGRLPKLLGAGDYNSVHAPEGFWGAVSVAEYIVYQPHQAVPKYVIEFEQI